MDKKGKSEIMDGWEERNSQPLEPKCTRGCLPGACYCAEYEAMSDEKKEEALRIGWHRWKDRRDLMGILGGFR